MCLDVREQHPLQQGLRLRFTLTNESSVSIVREQHPLQQGLRLFLSKIFSRLTIVREQHPLQQGLRQLRDELLS